MSILEELGLTGADLPALAEDGLESPRGTPAGFAHALRSAVASGDVSVAEAARLAEAAGPAAGETAHERAAARHRRRRGAEPEVWRGAVGLVTEADVEEFGVELRECVRERGR